MNEINQLQQQVAALRDKCNLWLLNLEEIGQTLDCGLAWPGSGLLNARKLEATDLPPVANRKVRGTYHITKEPQLKEAERKPTNYEPRPRGGLADMLRVWFTEREGSFSRQEVQAAMEREYPKYKGKIAQNLSPALINFAHRGELIRTGKGTDARYAAGKIRGSPQAKETAYLKFRDGLNIQAPKTAADLP